jgi:hypothetical protein
MSSKPAPMAPTVSIPAVLVWVARLPAQRLLFAPFRLLGTPTGGPLCSGGPLDLGAFGPRCAFCSVHF